MACKTICRNFSRPGLLVLVLVLWVPISQAATQTIGRTYPIAEPDALAEIEQKAASVDWQAEIQARSPKTYTALLSENLPRAPQERVRYYIPWYNAPFDVRDKDGKLLYPKGYRFNPLEYLRLPERVLVFSSHQLDWVRAHAQPYDMLILSQGDLGEVTHQLQRPVFLLNAEVRQRLDLEFVPTLVEQEGSTLKLHEFQVALESAKLPDTGEAP